MLRTALRPILRAGRPVAEQRRQLGLVTRLTLPARGVDCTPTHIGIPGELVQSRVPPRLPRSTSPALKPVVAPAIESPRAPAMERGTVLYLHGGAYVVGSPATHRSISSHLARRTGARVFVADYRLAPENRFPAAIDDAVTAYRALLRDGARPERMAIIGDSAGGGLALAAALRLRELGEPMPAALVLFSPWVDLGQVDRGVEPPGEVMLSCGWLAECARHYLGNIDSATPLASPIFGDLRGLPPTLVQVGHDELLLQDSRRLQSALLSAGVPSVLHEYPDRWHVFQLSAGVLADADRALTEVAGFLRERWGA